MYSIFADGVCIHDNASPLTTVKVISPKLTMEDNSAGKLEFTVAPDSVGYETVTRLASEIVVKKKGVEIWSGRVINEDRDFWNQRKIVCEGELAYLNDTSQPPAEYHDISVRDFLATLIRIHNDKATNDMQFTVGYVTVTDPNDSLYRYTNFESTLECIKDKLIDRLGGHIRIRKVNGVRYIDYLADYVRVCEQEIEFGKNLIDFTTSWDLSDLSTVIVPLGAALEESPIEALQAYTTVESVNDDSLYVVSEDAVAAYGWIESVVHWDDVSVPDNLLRKAKQYLEDVQFEDMVLEMSAVDLNYFNVNEEAIELLDEVICTSKPHGMSRRFPVKKLEIPLTDPENTMFTLGDKVKTTLSASMRKENDDLKKELDAIPSEQSTLNKAKKTATDIINLKTRGYITITSDENGSNELIISDTKDPDQAKNLWVWNLGGLGHFPNGRDSDVNLALTMDGNIVANRIVVGILGDQAGANYWNMETGEFKLSSNAKVGNSTVASKTDAANAASSAVSNYDNYTLNQKKVFDKLTNNGQTQGIYLYDGKVYINADYIQSGTITTDRLYTQNITDVGDGVYFKKGLACSGSIKSGKNGYIEGTLTVHGDLKVRGDLKAGGGYQTGVSKDWEIDGHEYHIVHGLIVGRD